MLRVLRQHFTARLTTAAAWSAPWASPRGIGRLERLIARLGPHAPFIARIIADNMRAAGVYSAEGHRAHFAQLAAHFGGALHVLRCAARTPTGISQELQDLAAERIALDDSLNCLWADAQAGRGAVVMGPHIANYLLNLTRLNQRVPITVYLRYSKDDRRRRLKQRWYQASGVGWISEPAEAGGPLGRLGRMADALRAGRVLFITPDLPRKPADGTAVRLFGREVYLPPGPAVLAVRSGAPLYMLTARQAGPRQCLLLHGPFHAAAGHRASRKAGVEHGMQWFADEFGRFVAEQPALWYLWGDKRWTRVFRDDPRYVGPVPPGTAGGAGEVH